MKALGSAVGQSTTVKKASAANHATAVEEVIVGKDVLELVSSAMYLDPMTVYREYVQNAADAIDQARQDGLLGPDERGQVDIKIESASRSVRIRDNGTGISAGQFVRRLTALGASGKRGTEARGFRGVGRLAGLGYSQELIFRSRSRLEDHVSELRWDCRRLREALRSTEPDTGIADLVRRVVTAGKIDAADYPEHFFEVELKGMVRLRSDRLMSPVAIEEYLGQVAPVPFAPEFSFGAEICAAIQAHTQLSELEITVSGLDRPIFRPHRNTVVVDDKQVAEFRSLELVEIPGVEGGLAGLGWVLHHDYEGAIPNGARIKGLRMRAGNIQVGEHALLEELFPEPRFNVWSVGEIHVLDKRIVPNGRRDHFEQNAHFHNLVNQLTPLARNIARHCRTSSVRRKWLRQTELLRLAAVEKIQTIQQGSISKKQRKAIAVETEQTFLQMDRIAAMEVLAEDQPVALKAVVDGLREQLGLVMQDDGRTRSPLERLSPQKRSMYEHFFELVYSCSTNRSAAKALVDRILLKVVPD